MLQSSLSDGVSFDPFALKQDGLAASEVNVGRCQVLQAFVVAPMIVVIDEVIDVRFEVTRQVVVFEEDAVLERLMPPLDLALRLRVAGRAAHVTHIAFVQPFGEVGRDVGRAIV